MAHAAMMIRSLPKNKTASMLCLCVKKEELKPVVVVVVVVTTRVTVRSVQLDGRYRGPLFPKTKLESGALL